MAFEALAAVAQGVEAALCLVLQYRAPPARGSRWDMEGPVWRAPGVPHAAVAFHEVAARGHKGAARAVLRISADRAPFTLNSRRAFEDDAKSLVFVLHLHGAVDAEVSNLNVARGTSLEVHALRDLPLYEPQHPMHRVLAARAPEVAALCGVARNGLPLVGPLSPEVLFTGAKEGDLVEVVQPTGVSFFLVAPREEAQAPRRRLLLALRRAKGAWSRRAELAARAQAAAAEHRRLLAAEGKNAELAELEAWEPWADPPPGLRERLRPLVALPEDWPRVKDAAAAAVWTARARNALAAAALLNGGPPLDSEDSERTHSESSDASRASSSRLSTEEDSEDDSCGSAASPHSAPDVERAGLAARLAQRLARDGVRVALEDRLELRHRMQDWERAASCHRQPQDFWKRLHARHGLPLQIANALRATDPGDGDVHDLLQALSAWLG